MGFDVTPTSEVVDVAGVVGGAVVDIQEMWSVDR